MTQTTMERIDKARRLLIEGRLMIHKVEINHGMVYAECRGDNGIYRLGFDPRGAGGAGEWRCSCPALKTCAHINALKLVVVR